MENIKNLCKYAVKYDDKNKYKAILEAAMVPTTEWLMENSPIDMGKLATPKKPSTRNSLSQFLALFDVKQKTCCPQNRSC